MRDMAWSILFVSAMVAGCAGTVEFAGDSDPFGTVDSAAYVVLDIDGDTVHYFVAANRAGLCGRLRDGFEVALDAWETWMDDPTDEARCDAYSEGLYDAWDPLVRGGTHFAFAFVADGSFWDLILGGTYDDLTRPSNGEWEVPAESFLQFTYFPDSTSPYEDAVEQQAGCDLAEVKGDGDRAIESLVASEGALELEEGSSDGWRIDFAVDLEDEDGSFVDEASGGFGAGRCEIDAGAMPASAVLDFWTFAPWGL